MDQFHGRHAGERRDYWYMIPAAATLMLILFICRQSNVFSVTNITDRFIPAGPAPTDRCAGRYIFVHDLPSRFNADILRDCRSLSLLNDMCLALSNNGLGPPLDDPDGLSSDIDAGWHNTNQFSLEAIFHNRMKQYECLTTDSSRASAIYVPFYAGLEIYRHLANRSLPLRDSVSLDLVRLLRSRPEWAAMGGRDHFLVVGRVELDFIRRSDEPGDWGNKFLLLPEARNMTVLIIESSPWRSNEIGIPYPSYFHPSKASQVSAWQDRMRKVERPWLFSFAGAVRWGQATAIRDRVMDQCRRSRRCYLLECNFGLAECRSTSGVMRAFRSSAFCLQPPGDTLTRRSIFDAMLAGCVPVFFHPGSAYVQYLWHLPGNHTRYSVFIPGDEVRQGNTSIEEVLSRFREEEISSMREEVIRLIPRLLYGYPRSLESLKDAFDVAAEGVIERMGQLRREIREGVSSPFQGSNGWKIALAGREGEHQWDEFFVKPELWTLP
ncbi:xyloglucan galactosyltransferase KATAMARI1 [Cocos nucifera]|uniref:Xyloglucan galactosyltransferase KATAMARI1 n=1 Tax=Cocos nucifera TaxID=13894 RepID=A0A8K0N0N9_COCNU|nr:xyloglucan galactosyltransferase KATAMARI1 [Cocos nucifera]